MVVNVPASIRVFFKAMRHNSELAAKAIMASNTRKGVERVIGSIVAYKAVAAIGWLYFVFLRDAMSLLKPSTQVTRKDGNIIGLPAPITTEVII
jgi:hypothetical protein